MFRAGYHWNPNKNRYVEDLVNEYPEDVSLQKTGRINCWY